MILIGFVNSRIIIFTIVIITSNATTFVKDARTFSMLLDYKAINIYFLL